MRNRVERLRVWLLGSAVFLVVVIAAFVGYARFLRHLRHMKIPANLGVNIVRESGGWTLSRAAGSRTLYTIHAAKWEQHTNGKVALHDVSIQLYGKDGTRRDRIYGDEFEYDQSSGVVRALGVVHIDLQAADVAGKPAAPSNDKGADAKVLHVTTSSLVYMEKLGVAATSEYIEFQGGGMTGNATGADYSSDSGMLVLHSAVKMSGQAGGQAVELTAASGSFDNHNQVAYLTQAKYSSAGRTAAADQATLHTRPDGSLERVEAQGNVTVAENGATATAQQADVAMNTTGQPETVVLRGGVKYAADKPLRQVRGQADVATIVFDGQRRPQARHAVFAGGVRMTERTRATDAAGEPWSMRELTAGSLDAVLAPTAAGRSELRDAEAKGSPKLTLVDAGSVARSKGAGDTSELSADEMKAHMLPAAGAGESPQLDTVAARGHTVLRQMSAKGVEQVSSGDVLDAKFRANPAGAKGRAGTAVLPVGGQMADSLVSALQQGHVAMMQRQPAKARSKTGDDVSHATATRAVYDGDARRMTLTGGVEVADAGSTLWANQVTLDQESGDSEAVGGVKVDYVEDPATGNPTRDGKTVTNGAPGTGVGAGEPTHFVADRAEMDRASDVATFHGKPVRMWQAGSQVQAPVIELDRAASRMIARSETATGWAGGAQPAVVHTVLMGASGTGAGTGAAGSGAAQCGGAKTGAAAKPGAGARAQEAVRIASAGLIFSGILRQAEFTGGVRADTDDATIRAAQATAFLEPKGASKAAAGDGTPSLTGKLERVVASGNVDVERPGLAATGERLTYNAGDRVFLLTGDGTTLPKAVGTQGTTTGAALRFDSCDDSVQALGAVPGAPVQRVRTDARVSSDQVKEKTRQ
jgi:lipopolysaccharide export system protein LptA